MWIVLFYTERRHCPLYWLLLRCASLFRHCGVYSLQSVPEAQSKAASYRSEKRNTRTGHACWLWPDGRKKADLYLSGNVQPHAGTAERMHISSPSDIGVIKINTLCFSILIFSKNYVLCSVTFRRVWISEPTRIHNVLQINSQYFICYCLLCPYILTCQCVTAQSMYIKVAL